MAIKTGVDGAALIDTTAFDVTNWTYTGTINNQETTPVGSTDQEFKQTTRGGSGSLTIVFDPANAQQKVIVDQLLSSVTLKEVLLQLQQDDTADDQLYFSAIIESVDMPVGANDVDVITVNYKKTGNLYHVPTT